MSTSSVGTSSMSSGFMPNSGRQTPESLMPDSRSSSWSNIYLGESSNIQIPSNYRGDSARNVPRYNPLLEALFDESANISCLMTREELWKNQSSSPQGRNEQDSVGRKPRKRELIIPDDEDEEYPFAKYTFNKKPDKDLSSSPSEMSCSSHGSSSMGDHPLALSRKRMHVTQQESNVSTWTSSLTSGLSEDVSSIQSSMPLRPDVLNTNYPNQPDPGMLDLMSSGYSLPGMNYMASTNSLPLSAMQELPDQVLMGLGFGGATDSFLPDRFAQDWCLKIHRARAEMIRRQQLERQRMEYSYPDFSDFETPLSSGMNTPLRRLRSNENIKAKYFQQHGTRSISRSSLVSGGASANVSFDGGLAGPNQLNERQSTIDKLKELLKTQQHQFQQRGCDARDMRRKQFAGTRQNSLPAYLETLTEEDEIRRIKNYSNSGKRLSRVSEVLSRESRDPESVDTSCSQSGMSTSGSESSLYSLTQEEPFEKNSMEEAAKVPINVPSITINDSGSDNPMGSNESLEIADIMQNNEKRGHHDKQNILSFKSELEIEPSMMSLVLHDSRDSYPKESTLSIVQPNYLSADVTDDRLLIPTTPSSSSSISPCPLSPVTVIEVNLDNQNDSLDTDDCLGTGSRKSSLDNESLDGSLLNHAAHMAENYVVHGIKVALETIKETNSSKIVNRRRCRRKRGGHKPQQRPRN